MQTIAFSEWNDRHLIGPSAAGDVLRRARRCNRRGASLPPLLQGPHRLLPGADHAPLRPGRPASRFSSSGCSSRASICARRVPDDRRGILAEPNLAGKPGPHLQGDATAARCLALRISGSCRCIRGNGANSVSETLLAGWLADGRCPLPRPGGRPLHGDPVGTLPAQPEPTASGKRQATAQHRQHVLAPHPGTAFGLHRAGYLKLDRRDRRFRSGLFSEQYPLTILQEYAGIIADADEPLAGQVGSDLAPERASNAWKPEKPSFPSPR